RAVSAVGHHDHGAAHGDLRQAAQHLEPRDAGKPDGEQREREAWIPAERECFLARPRNNRQVSPALELTHDASSLIGIAFDDEDLSLVAGERRRWHGFEARALHWRSFAGPIPQEACRI